MTTIPRILDLNSFADTVPSDITCGSVFSIVARFNSSDNSARITFTADEGYGMSVTYKTKVNSLKELAEMIRLVLFSANCDLSWFGRARLDNTIECQAANSRNRKCSDSFSISKWSLDAVGGLEWSV